MQNYIFQRLDFCTAVLTNSDCTIYSRTVDPSTGYSTWKRQYIPECWWFVETKSSVTTEGLKSADVLKVRVPDTSVKLQKDDILIKGVCDIEINTVKDLAAYRYYKALTVNYNLLGGSPHIKVVGA